MVLPRMKALIDSLCSWVRSRFDQSGDIDSLPISVETWRMTARVPKEHDRVTVEGHAGVLTIVDIHEQAQTADLRYVTGDGPVLEGVAWSALRYMDDGEAAAE